MLVLKLLHFNMIIECRLINNAKVNSTTTKEKKQLPTNQK